MSASDAIIAKALLRLMEARNITVADLSAGTSIPVQTIYYYLRKKTNQVDLSILKTLADFFHVELSYFLDPDHYEEPISLDESERLLLSTFRALNEQGKTRVKEYLTDLGGNPRFFQNDGNS